MPEIMKNLRDLAAKAAAADLPQEVAGFTTGCLTQPEVGAHMSVVGYSGADRARRSGPDQALKI